MTGSIELQDLDEISSTRTNRSSESDVPDDSSIDVTVDANRRGMQLHYGPNGGPSSASDSDDIYELPEITMTDFDRFNQPWADNPSTGCALQTDNQYLPRPKSSFVPEPLDILCLINHDDRHHPAKWSATKRWSIVTIYCVLQLFVTFTDTTYVVAKGLIKDEFGGSSQVITLGQSLFIAGNAFGPLIMSALSDYIGRKWVYVASIALFSILNFGCAYATNLPMLIIFMFLIGTAGSTALTNVAGTITDLFGDSDIAGQAMALFVVSANCGPSIGAAIGGLIAQNEHMGLNWIFLINVMIGAAFTIILCFVPETLPRLVIRDAVRGSGESVKSQDWEILIAKPSLASQMKFFSLMTCQLMVTEPIIITLASFNGFAYGIMFLYLDGLNEVFVVNNGLTNIEADLTYLNFVVGVVIMFFFMPLQTWCYRCDRIKHGKNRPEARFYTSLYTVWLFPISLLWFGYTSRGQSFWSPVAAGTVLAFADPLLWLGMLNYITDSYPNVAASAIAAFMIPSFLIAGGFAHVGLVLFARLTTVVAMEIIGWVSLTLCMLIYIFYFLGAKIRKCSRLAREA